MNLKDSSKKRISVILQMAWPLFFLIIGGFHDGFSMAYLAAAVEWCTIFLLLFLYALPGVMERKIRICVNKEQFKNAGAVFRGGVILIVVFWILTGIPMLIFSGALAKYVFHMPLASALFYGSVLFVLFASFIRVIQGLFQGIGSYMPTFVSGLICMILMPVGGIIFTVLFDHYGQKVSALLQNASFAGMYRSVGTASGIILACICTFIFLIFLFLGTGRRFLRKWKSEGGGNRGTLFPVCRNLLYRTVSIGIIPALSRLPVLSGIIIFQWITKGGKTDELGSYYICFEMFSLFFVFLFSVGFIKMQSAAINAVNRENLQTAGEQVNAGLQWCVLVSLLIPVFGLGAGPSFTALCFPKMNQISILPFLSGINISVFLVSFFAVGINASVGLKRKAVLSYLYSFAFYIVFLIIGLRFFNGSVYVPAVGQLLFGFCVSVINLFYLNRKIHFEPEVIRTFLIPVLASGITGLLLFGLRKLVYIYLGDGFMLLITVILGTVIYYLILYLLHFFHRSELQLMPGGKIISRIGSVFHLL